MSYSYITKVFPNFKYSNVYDASLYNNISGLNKTQDQDNVDSLKFNPINEANQYQEINKKYSEDIKPIDINLETYENTELSQGTKFLSQNNQTYYNKPQPLNLLDKDNRNNTVLINKTQLQKEFSSNQIPTNSKELKESFSQSEQTQHDIYIKHILECNQCKDMLMKQFNIETDRIRNEQILELIAFLIFGLFILLLLDKLKR